MLRNCNENGVMSNTNYNKHSDAVLRHKVRNLRAKVRCLLPVDVCKKYGKRNRHIKQTYERRQFLLTAEQYGDTKQGKSQWRLIPKECNKNKLFFEKPNQQRKHMFQKLTCDQVEQIKEDKLYYLGNQHVQAFEDFLMSRQYYRRVLRTADAAYENSRNRQNQAKFIDQRQKFQAILNRRKNKKTSSQIKQFQAMQNAISSVNNWFQELDNKAKHKSSVSNVLDKKKNRYASMENKFQIFYEKRKIMEQQSVYKKQMNKIAAQQKQIRAQNKFFQLRSLNQQKIKERNQQDQKKRQQAQKIVKQKQNIGEIKGLTEKLRRICLSKPLR